MPTLRSTTQPYFPLVKDMYEVVPLPWTQEVPSPADQSTHPNSLRLVRKASGAMPVFPHHCHHFTIPGNTRAIADIFVKAMQATVYWAVHKTKTNSPVPRLANAPNRGGRPQQHHFKLEFKCPQKGTHIFVSNSFTSPLAVAYWVDYEVPSKRHAKPRILRCTCPHFQQHNSACKHMFCIAKQYKYLVVEAGCVPEAPPMDIEALLNNLYEDGALNKLDPAPAFVPVGLGSPNPSNQPLRLLSLCPADLLYNGDLEIKVILSNGSGSAPVKRPASRQQYDLQGALTEDPKSSELGPESPEEGQQGNAGTN
ncbi:hypothetical protein PtA15_15A241 [Puccinia triticina]|uniref:SWIM-type domain-containing protein n=1 Tax=Puccinia triticina TaxID=208348 RepID=A0ABY7D2K8_9BASI|nr:uncharacterized protein PtA15_15A241 [Puccinia triticina]WAQ91849.1 hypothetical protein PtA15_15A241 [Puccinia triticina]